MSMCAFDHPFLSGLFGDDEIAACFSAEADIRAMLAFEAALARAEAACKLIPEAAAQRIAEIATIFVPDMTRLKTATATDGVVIPELVRQLKEAVGGREAQYIHLGATSQDAIDTSLMLRLQMVTRILADRIIEVLSALDTLDAGFGQNALMAYTRMQAAIPITVSNRLSSWRMPLKEGHERLVHEVSSVQFGGPAGTLEKLGAQAEAVRDFLALDLGLLPTPQWQSQRGRIADFGHILSRITGAAGKIGQDISLLAQSGSEIAMSGGGSSSAMAHKQNPVAAETLVTLARFNAVQISGLHQSLVHEQERSGAAWSLEWLILPQMAMATGASLRLCLQLAKSITRLGN